jgi:hypothetical protein
MKKYPHPWKAFLLFLSALATFASAASACHECFFNRQNIATCRPVFDDEIGHTQCYSITDDCVFGGNSCIVVYSGGGSTGGGGSCSTTQGGCPAECFSCTGGGSPRI